MVMVAPAAVAASRRPQPLKILLVREDNILRSGARVKDSMAGSNDTSLLKISLK